MYEWIGLNGSVIKTIEVKENSKEKGKIQINFYQEKKTRQSTRHLIIQECIETVPLCHIDIVKDLSLRKR